MSSLSSWYRIASIPKSNNSSPQNIIPQIEDDDHNHASVNNGSSLHDNRRWVEHMEVEWGCPCAYEVLRCDLHNTNEKQEPVSPYCTIWGQDYHLQRLKLSFRELVRQQKQHIHDGSSIEGRSESGELECKQDSKPCDEICEESAIKTTKAIITSLIHEACNSFDLDNNFKTFKRSKGTSKNGPIVQIIKVTILWKNHHLPSSGETDCNFTDKVVIKGHATCNGIPFEYFRRPDPITATVALPNPHLLISNIVPNRKKYSHAKITSWAKERKPLEQESTFRPSGTSEVLLVGRIQGTKGPSSIQPSTSTLYSNMEILEGLTSNFFAIYRDGTVRTANDGILLGYVRHLVLNLLSSCELTLDKRPCLMSDGVNNLWREAFITSSSRLIYPIEKILVPNYEVGHEGEFAELWRKEKEQEQNVNGCDSYWEILYDKLLQHVS